MSELRRRTKSALGHAIVARMRLLDLLFQSQRFSIGLLETSQRGRVKDVDVDIKRHGFAGVPFRLNNPTRIK